MPRNSIANIIYKIITDYIGHDIDCFYVNYRIYICGVNTYVNKNLKLEDIDFKNENNDINIKEIITNLQNNKDPCFPKISLNCGLYIIDNSETYWHTIYCLNRHFSYKFKKF